MIKRYLYIVLLIGAWQITAVHAQTAKPVQKKPVTKPAQKKPAVKKPIIKPLAAKPVAKPIAHKLGDAAAKVRIDTAKRGGTPAPSGNKPAPEHDLSEEIVVTTIYKPVLADAVKIRRNPNLENAQPFKAPLTYNTLDKKLERNSDIRPLEAMKMPAELDSARYNNYIRAGLGSLKTNLIEAFVGNGKDEALQYGAYARHFGQNGVDYPKQNETKDQITLYGKSIGASNTVTGLIDYNWRGYNFYGYSPVNFAKIPPTTASTAVNPAWQYFNTLDVQGELARNYQDTDRAFTYALRAKGYVFSNTLAARENNVVISGFVNETINQFYAGLSGSLDLGNQKDSLYNINNSLLRLNPYLKFQGDNYKIDAGVNIVKEFGAFNKFYIFPAAKLEVQVVPKYVRLFAEAKGDVNRTSIRSLSEINPFIGQNINIQNSVDAFDIAAGLKGTIAPGLGFKASVFFNSVRDLPLFISNILVSPAGNNRFNVIYDTGLTHITGFDGELDYKASENVDLFGKVEFKNYKMATLAQPWNLPKFKLTAGTILHISSKIDINSSLLVRGSTIDNIQGPGVAAANNQTVTLKSFADLNGGITYKAAKRIKVFLQVNNILNTHYQTWLYYPNYGFNIFGGAGFSF